MRAFSREVKSSYYKYQSLPRNLTQEKRLQQLHTLKQNQTKVGIYKYSTDDQLGKGFSSKVYKAVEIENKHKRYAIKVIQLKKFRGSNLEMLEAEIQIHKGLIHENIVRLFEVIKTPYFYYIVLEYCPHGNLHEYIRQKKKLSQNNAIQIMDQVLSGVRYLMEQGVIHRDLKPANILRMGNKWKISDFGFSVKSKYGFKDRINVGTPLYMSPQSLKKSYYSAKTDVYSLGIILYQMLDGKTPFESKNEKQLLQKMKNQIVVPPSIKNPKIHQFIEKCCQMNEAKRMSRQELMQFQVKSNQVPSSEKDSVLASSFSRATTHLRRPSILSQQIRAEQQVLRHHIELLYNQFLLVRHLYSCIKNIESFLLQREVKQQFVLALFKLLLKLVRFLCDKKHNHFDLKHWEDLVACKSYIELYQKMLDQTQIYEKEYLEQIKLIDIKIIRSINRKFPDLCNNNKISHRFYYDFNLFLARLIRSQNHQIMLVYISSEGQDKELPSQNQNKELVQLTSTKESAKELNVWQGRQLVNIDSIYLQQIAAGKNRAEEELRKSQIATQKNQFLIEQSELISPALMQPKKDSRLLIKRLSKASSNANNERQICKNGKQVQNNLDQSKINTKKTLISLIDKYQALQSLFTIYRVCELRCSNEDKGQLTLQKIKVVESYQQSKIEGKDYLDLRRLLRSI